MALVESPYFVIVLRVCLVVQKIAGIIGSLGGANSIGVRFMAIAVQRPVVGIKPRPEGMGAQAFRAHG